MIQKRICLIAVFMLCFSISGCTPHPEEENIVMPHITYDSGELKNIACENSIAFTKEELQNILQPYADIVLTKEKTPSDDINGLFELTLHNGEKNDTIVFIDNNTLFYNDIYYTTESLVDFTEFEKLFSESVYLNILNDSYPLDTTEEINYEILNRTQATRYVSLVPKFEYRTESGWENVTTDVGFCGTNDPVSEKLEGILPLSWFTELKPGTYRLSYEMKDSQESLQTTSVSDIVTLY